MAAGNTTKRLDIRLVEDGLARTRSQARDAVLRGTVLVDGAIASKPGQLVTPDRVVSCATNDAPFVSRAALKLAHGLDQAGFDVAGKICLDLGASTGGFTEVLLRRGAARVFAVDVGHGQIHEAVRDDARVVVLEKLNARDLTASHLDDTRLEVIVADVSFISLKLVLPPALALAARQARLVALIKPQFEAGREHIARGGVVRDRQIHDRVCADIARWLDTAHGWRVGGVAPSPVVGAQGNQEFLIWAQRGAASPDLSAEN